MGSNAWMTLDQSSGSGEVDVAHAHAWCLGGEKEDVFLRPRARGLRAEVFDAVEPNHTATRLSSRTIAAGYHPHFHCSLLRGVDMLSVHAKVTVLFLWRGNDSAIT